MKKSGYRTILPKSDSQCFSPGGPDAEAALRLWEEEGDAKVKTEGNPGEGPAFYLRFPITLP